MIDLNDGFREAFASALVDGFPIVVATVDPEGQPSLGYYGSAQVYSTDQLALWVRNREGGLLRRISEQPRISLLYRHAGRRVMWQFQGRARVDEDEAVRTAVFEASPEPERDRDPERGGAAVIVDVDRVIERGHAIMER